jgi:hypothetical protein
VQFARKPDGNPLSLYAIKFFAAWRDFQEEVEVYRNSPLRSFMPSVLHTESNEDCKIRDPFGGLIPPFIVMEKGESLQERARNSQVDVFTAAQVLPFFQSLSFQNLYWGLGLGIVWTFRSSRTSVPVHNEQWAVHV